MVVAVRSRLAVLLILGVAIVFALLFARQMYLSRGLDRAAYSRKLRILTYSTFVSSSGPGGELIDTFKKAKGIDVDVVTTADAGLMLERLKLSADNAAFDVIIGLDQNLIPAATERFQWHPLATPEKFFVAFDWAPLTFIYREGDEAPITFDDLLNSKYKAAFALQDPRNSSPGLQFYEWVRSLKHEGTREFLEKFKPNVQSVSPSWSFSYGVFKKKQARFVFSYVTSLAFHWGIEKDRSYRAVSFPEGHPVQTEYAAVPSSCQECELAEQFVNSMLTPESQKIIMLKNFMLPVLPAVEKGTIYEELPKLKTLATSHSSTADFHDWDEVFKK